MQEDYTLLDFEMGRGMVYAFGNSQLIAIVARRMSRIQKKVREDLLHSYTGNSDHALLYIVNCTVDYQKFACYNNITTSNEQLIILNCSCRNAFVWD